MFFEELQQAHQNLLTEYTEVNCLYVYQHCKSYSCAVQLNMCKQGVSDKLI